MATLYIDEFDHQGVPVAGSILPCMRVPPHVEQSVTFTTSAASAAFHERTKVIRVIADAKAHLSFGASPTATASNRYIAADSAEYFQIIPGQKVAAYDGTS